MHIYEEKDPKSNEDVTEGAKVKIEVVTNRMRRLPETTKRRPKKEWRGNFRNCIRTERQYRRKKNKWCEEDKTIPKDCGSETHTRLLGFNSFYAIDQDWINIKLYITE
uniref:Uncharacterized protein n=1 Tax=Gossypium raimondii TaxID=29730 RepID=A0A0D2PPM1_GOSRA|nr:hypothetical protein B456_008G060000 [Gossypium raimondii]